MGTARRIKKTTGYPTTDKKSFDTYKEAIKHQTDIDLDAECEGAAVVNADDMKSFLKTNVEVVQEYIKHHLTPKKPAPEKTAKPQAAAKKTADKEAAK